MSTAQVSELKAVGRLPVEGDNAAIATRHLPAGMVIRSGEMTFTLPYTVMVGHRFAVQPIAPGQPLTSWGQRFGVATRPIMPGEYVINEGVLTELQRRNLDFELPPEANFQNELEPYQFDLSIFVPSQPLPRYPEMRTFMGYRRGVGRGVGTRNTIVLLGTSALTSGFVRALESRLQLLVEDDANLDGIVAVAHTEGGRDQANNRDLLLRTLAGFMVNPNVGAVLAVDYGHEIVHNGHLRDYLHQHGYPIDDLPHHFMSLSPSFEGDLDSAAQIVTGWLDTVSQTPRTPEPLSELKIGLQCGGSDAFSGISGNPLAAWVAKEVIRYGGSANLAETDELIGAETYVLDKVRDAVTAQKFLSFIQRFKERVEWHGHSAEGNPSGGNKYRGLYNIYLKSLGAATKRHPDVPIDAVIDYAEPMQSPGYYFMDSPGNDLESVAGQVASGCNMIFFVTGNGSITNFPFVPTLKIVTTTERYQLLSNEMDINAGAYLDGVPMDELGAETLNRTVEIASGALSAGEKAAHAQVQIWRDWPQARPVNIVAIQSIRYTGQPISIQTDDPVPAVSLPAYRNGNTFTTDQVGLILPTSLCSGQIAQMCVQTLNRQWAAHATEHGRTPDISRFVTLVHTEGCGASVNPEFRDTLLGYLTHPMVKHALLLEHGCESTHNDYFRQNLRQRGLNPEDYGWASIQLDGGIQRVIRKMSAWFDSQMQQSQQTQPTETVTAGLEAVRVALVTHGMAGALPDTTANALAVLTRMIVNGGGTVVIPQHDPLLTNPFNRFTQTLGLSADSSPSLAYGQPATQAGFHIMATPAHDWNETLTGLGATGIELILAHVSDLPLPGHPMLPVLQVTTGGTHDALDLTLDGSPDGWPRLLLDQIIATLSHDYIPQVQRTGTENVVFQITRGLLGVSL